MRSSTPSPVILDTLFLFRGNIGEKPILRTVALPQLSPTTLRTDKDTLKILDSILVSAILRCLQTFIDSKSRGRNAMKKAIADAERTDDLSALNQSCRTLLQLEFVTREAPLREPKKRTRPLTQSVDGAEMLYSFSNSTSPSESPSRSPAKHQKT
jgi:hypothetical protein